jgi:glyoxylase-like metal-dependent hydrolase (beta-lactamase superfamily II)
VIKRILAPNPSLYTGPGTNTYVVDDGGEALIIDPGPIIASHELEILRAVDGFDVIGVVATHTHPDHAPMANPLATRLSVPVFGYGPGPAFLPDIRLDDGDEISFGRRRITAVHTPGHTPDHLCFRLDETLLTGDHIMSGSTVIIEDAATYLESLYKVRDLALKRLEPGHGNAVSDAGALITDYIEHRIEREKQILDAVRQGAGTIGDIVDVVYTGIPDGLRPAAVHQVAVQLKKLFDDSVVWFEPGLAEEQTEVRAR